MCGIVAVLQRDAERAVPETAAVLALVAVAEEALPDARDPDLPAGLRRAATSVEAADRLLRGAVGVRCLVGDPSGARAIDDLAARLETRLDALEAALDATAPADPAVVEAANAGVVRLRDALWSLRRDRVRTAAAVEALAGPGAAGSSLAAFYAIQVALSAIDRLEVRGRDSAGVHVLVSGHGLDPDDPAIAASLLSRQDPLFRSGAVRLGPTWLSVVYKAAAEIGELGDNTRVLREAISSDALLRRATSTSGSRTAVLAHTRWASVGAISEPNAHPLTSEEESHANPYVVSALNGDVDNHTALRASERIVTPPEITTDAKVIPLLVGRRITAGDEGTEAFRQTVASFEGSVAIAAQIAEHPDRIYLALRGSGQALYVGCGEDAFVVASEPYGLVEQAGSYLRMEGNGGGQVVVLDASGAGTVEGIERIAYSGTALPVASDEFQVPEITTRDIDRGPYPHFLLKEITQAPTSLRKTLRGRLARGPSVVIGAQTLPAELVDRLRSGAIRRICVIGQGTAAVAGRSLAALLSVAVRERALSVEAMPATELSGFGMRDDMSDTLVVVISQSGTTADTNRTVDAARGRGAAIVSIVNRRQSDLVDRSDGVLYTSDGRDVEMAVPSTKAFYAQIAAGLLLAVAIADHVGAEPGPDRGRLLEGLRRLPEAMETVLARRDEIAAIAQRHAPGRRYWAIVGNGMNRIAAEELRIKLSELCYRSISCDVTEDKKHIDLSAEPLILVCAAGLEGSNADDVGKEVAIYRAHKASPLVIASDGDDRYRDAVDVMRVPAVHPELDFVLATLAGHLFGYEAALAIDAGARPLREARAAIESVTASTLEADQVLARLRAEIEPVAVRFFDGLRAGFYDGNLEPSTAVRLTSLLRYATGSAPLESYQVEYGVIGTPAAVVEDLYAALSRGIDELTRPVDAIRHQAKTVTVGISRTDETYLRTPLVRELLAAGIPRDNLTYRVLRSLASLDPAVGSVAGYTHYRVDGDVRGAATLHVVDRGGVARDIPSRTEQDPRLRGTKHRVAVEREVLVTRGREDGREILVVPEVKGTDVTGITVLHVSFADRLPAPVMRGVLEGYRDRLEALSDLVMETEPNFREELLGEIPVIELLVDSIQALADRWRTP